MPTVVLRALPAQLAEQRGEVGCAKRVCVPGWPFAHKDALKAAGFWWDSDNKEWWKALKGPKTVEELQARCIPGRARRLIAWTDAATTRALTAHRRSRDSRASR